MELVALVLMPPAVAVAAAVGWWFADRRAGWLDSVVRRRLLVHTRDGQTFDGPLVRVDRDGVVLGPVVLADGPHDLDGEVFILRERVAWVQHPADVDPGSVTA